jgi:hypothetical protein
MNEMTDNYYALETIPSLQNDSILLDLTAVPSLRYEFLGLYIRVFQLVKHGSNVLVYM